MAGRPGTDVALRWPSTPALADAVVIGGGAAPVLAMQGSARSNAVSALLRLKREMAATMPSLDAGQETVVRGP